MDLLKDNSVTAVIITYGNRWHILVKVLTFLEHLNEVEHIVLVDNATPYSLHENVEGCNFKKVHIIRNIENIGSAGGFYRGISYAHSLSSEFILLLDDDNLPKNNAIMLMRDLANDLLDKIGNAFVLIGYRSSVYGKTKIFHNIKLSYFDRFSFLGLNVFTFIRRHFLGKFYNRKDKGFFVKDSSGLLDLSGLSGCAYGGMMFHKSLIDKIGLPNKELVLYWDDVEYSNRLISNGGKIYLLREAEIDDIEDNYGSNFFNKPFFGFIESNFNGKIYYQVRNIVFFDFHVTGEKKILYLINLIIYIVIFVILATYKGRFEKNGVIFRAVKDGLFKNLGLRYPLNY